MKAMNAGLFSAWHSGVARLCNRTFLSVRFCLSSPPSTTFHIPDAAKMMPTISERAMMTVDNL
jgi:hypothetical protein